MQCEECYIDKNRITPLIKPRVWSQLLSWQNTKNTKTQW